jgi:hypothetical protein
MTQINEYQFILVPKWELIDYPFYYFTTDKKLYNIKTNRIIKKRVKGYSVGYTLNNKFVTLKNIKVKKINKLSNNL